MKKTIVFVTHDIDEAIKMGDKICLLKDGHLVQFASPEEILTHPKNDFVADFVGGDRTLKRLNLFTIKRAMKDNPPVISQDKTIEAARNMFAEIESRYLITVDGEGTLTGVIDKENISNDAVLVKDAFKTHDYGFLIVVDDTKKVLGWLHTEDIKTILKG